MSRPHWSHNFILNCRMSSSSVIIDHTVLRGSVPEMLCKDDDEEKFINLIELMSGNER